MTYQPERIAAEQRSLRSEVSLTCEVRQGNRPWATVRLYDISETGFRIDWRPGFDDRHPMYIKIPGLALLTSHLRWKREAWIGGEFSSPLYPAVYDHIVQQSKLEG